MRNIITMFWRWWYRHHQTPSRFTKEEALAIARKYHLEAEVLTAMQHGCNPNEALQEWDLFSYENRKK